MKRSVRFESRQSSRLWLPVILLCLAFAAFFLWLRVRHAERDIATASLQTLESLSRKEPDALALLCALGARQRQLGLIPAAHTTFERAASLDSMDEAAWIGWATTTNGPTAAHDTYAILTDFLKRRPDSAAAHLELGQWYRQARRPLEAYREAVRAIELDSRSAAAWKLRGGEAAALGKRPEAEQGFRQALSLQPDDWRIQLGLGAVLMQLNRVPEAIGCYRLAVGQAPRSALANRLLGQALQTKGTSPTERSESMLWLKQADALTQASVPEPVPVSPGSLPLDLLLRDADELRAQHRLDEAQQAYSAILRRDPESARAYAGLGLLYKAQNKQEEAFFALDTATRLNPHLPEAQATLGGWYLEASFTNEAIRRLELATQDAPNDADVWHRLGMAYSAAGVKNPSAEVAQRRAVKLNPENAQFFLDFGDILTLTGKQDEAEQAYRTALKLSPHDADSLARLGAFLLNTRATPERQQEAERLLREAVAVRSDDDFALYHLGRLLYDQRKDREAIAVLSRAVALTPDIPEPWYLLARACTRTGDTARASAAQNTFSDLRKFYLDRMHTSELVSAQPKRADLRLKQARLYAQNGENAKAISSYLACLQLAPKNTTARQELDRLQIRLKASGRLPSMRVFRAMNASALHHT